MSLVRCAGVLFLAALVAAQRPTRDQQKQFSQCLIAGGTRESCRSNLGESSPSTTPRDEVTENLEAERGAPAALAEQLKTCSSGQDGNTDAEKKEAFEACKQAARQSLQTLRGEAVEPEELERELERAGQESARNIIKTCLDAATTETAKDACFNSDEAKREMAAISGRDATEFKADDMREAMREGAARDLVDEVSSCRKNAQTDAAKKECMKPSEDLKKQIADSRGKASTEIKDSEVREFLLDGAEEDMWKIMERCSDDREECLKSAKEMLGAATGEAVTALTNDMMERRLNDKMKDELAESMQACMRSATDDAARARCRDTLVDQALKTANNRTKHSKGEKNQALKEAGKAAAKDVTKDCKESRDVCLQRLREKAAESMGRRPEELTDVELERLNMEGSKEAAKEALKSCTSAKKTDTSATCDDALGVYASGRGRTLSDADQRRVTMDLAEDLEKDDMMQCLKSESRDEYAECMKNLPEREEVQEELFRGVEDKVKEAKKKRAKSDAQVDAVGDLFRSCMEEAATDSEKEECKNEMKGQKEMVGMTEDVDDVVMKYQRNVVAESARACDATKRSECVLQAKQELVKMGLKRRAFGMVKKLADLKEAAEAFAECQEDSTATGVDATCVALAKSTLEDLSGSTEIWNDEVAEKVQDLGNAFMEGREIFIRKLKQVLVEAVSSAATCSDAFLNRIIDRVMGVARNFTVPGSEKPRNVTDKSCRVAFGKARYFCKVPTEGMDDSETEEMSDDISEELTTADLTVRRLSFRRLAETITETYADQEVEETSTSSSTTTTTTAESTLPDSGVTTQGTENPTHPASAATSVSVGAAMALLLFSML